MITTTKQLRALLVSGVAAITLAACGGGAETVDNPISGGPVDVGDAPYTGPVAANEDVLRFQQEFWSNAKSSSRCGACHNEVAGQQPLFVRNDDVNLAYDASVGVVDLNQPETSRLVTKVGGGHNCWVDDPGVCATIMTTWIENWVGDSGGDNGREIRLTPPVAIDPGSSRNFPDNSSDFGALIHQPILAQYCSDCHNSGSANAIQPFLADEDLDVAYAAARSRINLDGPDSSRLVLRLRNEFHNCWDVGCAQSAQIMEDAITAFAGGIPLTEVDPNLVTSKALRLVDGTLAAGGNRFEDAQIALWEFRTGTGNTAFDSSGVDPALDLNFSGDVSWFGGWGITITDGKAQATTTASRKLYDVIQESGEFSMEAWVIPANVTQEMARIMTYSSGQTSRNFTLQQNLYDYQFQLRTTETGLNGDPALSTPSADEVLQATLQHVVATYSPIEGRRIYVNGELVSNTDPVPGGSLVDWQDTFAFVIGNEASSDGLWQGTVRMAAIHRRSLSQEQVTQNFDAGVGERFYMLFDISENISAAAQSSYILYEVQQFDTHAYLFDQPHFITLDGSSPEGIPLEGIRVAMNGQEVEVGQSYALLNQTLSAAQFQELGQPLSSLGAVLPLDKGPEDDQFFLTFDRLGTNSYTRPEIGALVISEPDLDPASQIGVRTFDEINATFAAVTQVDPTTASVDMTYQELRQSLPAIADINTFLSSHQVAIAQLAIQYCDAMIGSNANPNPNAAAMFPGFNFGAAPASAFAGANRDALINPLIDRFMGTSLASNPARADVYAELASFTASGGRPDNLVDRLVAGGSDTRAISKGVCAAMLGSATTLIQ
ncbi:MAG: LamG domain-containing protein [Pseudomonadota bacterium]